MKEMKEAKAAKVAKEPKEAKAVKEAKEPKDAKAPKEAKETKEAKEPKEAKAPKEPKTPKASKSAKGSKESKEQKEEKALSIKTLSKSSVWDLQENDVFRLLDSIMRDAEMRENFRHHLDIVRSAFLIEELKDDDKRVKQKYINLEYKVGGIRTGEESKLVLAIKKRPILRVTDLTYENIRHISAAKLVEVLDRNFGGGWDSLSQSIQDIIESGFDISTTTLPKDRLHKKCGMYEKKVADGYEVLEVSKGAWVEAIFAKLKPESYKPRMVFDTHSEEGDEDDDEDIDLPEDDYNKPDEDDVDIEEPDDDEINENNYRTTFDLSDGDDDEDAESLSDYIADE